HPPLPMSMTIARYRFGDYVLDLPKHELLHRGTAVALPARVFECLGCLIEHRDRAVGRDELVQAVFGRPNVSDAQLAQVVLRSRRAVGDDGQEQHTIRTVPRFGFRWLAPVTAEPAQAEAQPAASGAGEATASAHASSPRTDTRPGSATPPAPAPEARPQPATRPGTARWRRWAAAVPALVAVLTLACFLQRPPAAGTVEDIGVAATAPAQRAIMVLPTRVQGPDDASWVRLGLMDFIGDRLQRSGLPVLPSENTLGVLHQQAGDDPARLRSATRARWIIGSHAIHGGDDWQVRLHAGDDAGVEHEASARDADLLQAARLATARLAAALGGRAIAGGDDPPALAERLQRARAAMLANRIETARGILLAAPELQRAQPRLRYQLPRLDFRAGQYARGLATLDAVLDDTATHDDPVF